MYGAGGGVLLNALLDLLTLKAVPIHQMLLLNNDDGCLYNMRIVGILYILNIMKL